MNLKMVLVIPSQETQDSYSDDNTANLFVSGLIFYVKGLCSVQITFKTFLHLKEPYLILKVTHPQLKRHIYLNIRSF